MLGVEGSNPFARSELPRTGNPLQPDWESGPRRFGPPGSARVPGTEVLYGYVWVRCEAWAAPAAALATVLVLYRRMEAKRKIRRGQIRNAPGGGPD